jgi:hypothetical protein
MSGRLSRKDRKQANVAICYRIYYITNSLKETHNKKKDIVIEEDAFPGINWQ